MNTAETVIYILIISTALFCHETSLKKDSFVKFPSFSTDVSIFPIFFHRVIYFSYLFFQRYIYFDHLFFTYASIFPTFFHLDVCFSHSSKHLHSWVLRLISCSTVDSSSKWHKESYRV